jgi:hypothetical protein
VEEQGIIVSGYKHLLHEHLALAFWIPLHSCAALLRGFCSLTAHFETLAWKACVFLFNIWQQIVDQQME